MHSECRPYKPEAKSDGAGEWGGCGRISVDGPGHYNPDRSEGHWVRTKSPHDGATKRRPARHRAGVRGADRTARRAEANRIVDGKALPEMSALKPYRGKPAVRNLREGDGNNGIIEARLAPSPYSTTRADRAGRVENAR